MASITTTTERSLSELRKRYKPVKFDGTISMTLFATQIFIELTKARLGSREAESNLIDLLGSLNAGRGRRPQIPDHLCKEVDRAMRYLSDVGRRFDFHSLDQRYWISARGGGPRNF
jgi:hypothetical protein